MTELIVTHRESHKRANHAIISVLIFVKPILGVVSQFWAFLVLFFLEAKSVMVLMITFFCVDKSLK